MNLLVVFVALSAALETPNPAPPAPGLAYQPGDRPTAAGAPTISSFTSDAGPDQSFLLVGENLTEELTAWGANPDAAEGREIKPKVQINAGGVLVATLPERCYDGPIVVWDKNQAGYSAPVVLNAPEVWWSLPDEAVPDGSVRVFGRNLAQRPGFARAHVYLARQGRPGVWLKAAKCGKYELTIDLPREIEPGQYQLWVHAGIGGDFGWSNPLPLAVAGPTSSPAELNPFTSSPDGPFTNNSGSLQAAVDRLGAAGGGTLRLAEESFDLAGTLVVPANVHVVGAGRERTTLVSPADPAAGLVAVVGGGWNQAPTAIHSIGDRMVYKVQIPAEGTWAVWLRYATDMSPWKQPGVSGRMTLAADGGAAVPLENLPNTGSFGTVRWSRSAELHLTAGAHELTWKNERGGGIHLDALVFALDPGYTPGDNPLPESGPRVVVVQGEDVVRFETKEGRLPGVDRAAVWLAGDGASISGLTICGSPRTNLGVIVRSPRYPQWIRDCRVSRVKVCDVQGKQAENCGVRLFNAEGAVVSHNELWGRAPLFFSGVRQSEFTGNRLVSMTLWGGNAEAYILSRNDVVRQCVIEDNVCACPPGDDGGGPTGRRMLWFSTGRGSVDCNWIANNREDWARFGGVAGTDQNVGEMILFEACERIAFHGPAAGAEAQSVTLPATLPATPDDRLGSVKREQLAHDAAGNETPYWPPDVDQGTSEPVVGEYFVTVLHGRGLGQTRRVLSRQGTTYRLDRPWRVVPAAGDRILVHTAYRHNHIVANRTVDGMTGVQLWISCIDNVVSGNVIGQMRKPGLYLFGNCSTLASSMPTSWNRGIGPLYFNQIEGTYCDETSCGALVTSGEAGLPVEFPRCLGNVLRHNSFLRSRADGVLVTGNRRPDDEQPSPAVLGTIVELNAVRDATVGYHVAQSAEATLLRRNHAYFWYPVNLQPGPRVAFQLDNEKASAALELNTVEGIHGVPDGQVIQEQRGPGKMAPAK